MEHLSFGHLLPTLEHIVNTHATILYFQVLTLIYMTLILFLGLTGLDVSICRVFQAKKLCNFYICLGFIGKYLSGIAKLYGTVLITFLSFIVVFFVCLYIVP